MPSESPLTPDQEAELHRRLLRSDPLAPSRLADAYFLPLIAHLRRVVRNVTEEMCSDAAEEAILNLGERPETCVTGSSLWKYLRMSASRDLKNIQRSQYQNSKLLSLDSVELGGFDGNCFQSNDTTSEVDRSDEAEHVRRQYLPIIGRRLTTQELLALDLYIDGVRETAPYAKALGLEHMPADVQAEQVKRTKDKLAARIKRARDER